MAKQNNEANPEAGLQNIEENLGKAEQFIEKNSRMITYSFIGLILVILVFMGYNKYILKPNQVEAFDSIFHAENYFKQDSLNKALNGDGTHDGFLDVIDKFGSTKSGNLAHFYAASCYMQMAKNDTSNMKEDHLNSALKHFKKFGSDDIVLAPIAIGRQGDIQMELGNLDKAASLYVKAARLNSNDFTAPDFLKRAGMTYSLLGQHDKALEMYKEIKKEHYQSYEASNIDGFIALEEAQL